MFYDDKPPLNEALLVHFGVRGMHWGHRKAPPTYFNASTKSYGPPKNHNPSANSRSTANPSPPKKKSKTKKILAGAAVVGGVAAAALILSRTGNTSVISSATNHLDLGPAGGSAARAAQTFTNHLDLGSSAVHSPAFSHVMSTPLSAANVQSLYNIARG